MRLFNCPVHDKMTTTPCLDAWTFGMGGMSQNSRDLAVILDIIAISQYPSGHLITTDIGPLSFIQHAGRIGLIATVGKPMTCVNRRQVR